MLTKLKIAFWRSVHNWALTAADRHENARVALIDYVWRQLGRAPTPAELRRHNRLTRLRERRLRIAGFAAKRWGVLLGTVLLLACGGQVEPNDAGTCRVPFEREGRAVLCEFECADCDGTQESCEAAAPTAADACLYQLTHDEEKP